jgi:uncharacterized membrane protein
MEFVYFLGRYHVLALHVPIGVILAVALLEILARFAPRFQSLRAASPFLWGVAAVSAIGTVALGFMHVSEGGFDGPSVSRHMVFGSSVALVATATWGLALFARPLFERAAMWAGLALVFLVSATGHYGGNITHGSTYLVEYAPGFIRALHDGGGGRSRVTDLAQADPFLDVVKPILDRRCASCHNDDRRRGELSMTTYEQLMAGGEFLPVIVAGDAEASQLIQRIVLYPGHEDFMPAEGKTPLTGRQTEILRWWVNAGAPANTTMASLELAPEVEALLRAELRLD